MAFYTIYTFFTYINIILYFHILFQYLMMAIEKNFCIWMAQYLLHIKVPAYVYFKLLLTFYIQIYKSILSAYIKCHIKSKSVSHQQKRTRANISCSHIAFTDMNIDNMN